MLVHRFGIVLAEDASTSKHKTETLVYIQSKISIRLKKKSSPFFTTIASYLRHLFEVHPKRILPIEPLPPWWNPVPDLCHRSCGGLGLGAKTTCFLRLQGTGVRAVWGLQGGPCHHGKNGGMGPLLLMIVDASEIWQTHQLIW